MIAILKSAAGKAISTIWATVMFVLMLPVMLAAMAIMTVAGMIAFANLRHRLREGVSPTLRSYKTKQAPSSEVKPPIEGHYTVVKE